jgi:hypothetical protein
MSRRWNQERRELLIDLWQRGTIMKQIAIETGMSASACKDERIRLGLPPRWVEGSEPQNNRVTVHFNDQQFEELKQAALRNHCRMATYIRKLVIKDCGAEEGN